MIMRKTPSPGAHPDAVVVKQIENVIPDGLLLGENGALLTVINSFGVPNHSYFEPDYFLAKRNGKPPQIAA